MEDGLGLQVNVSNLPKTRVLILVLMEDGLGPLNFYMPVNQVIKY